MASCGAQVNREARVDCALAELYTRSLAVESSLQGQKHAEVMTKLYVRMNEVGCSKSQNQFAEALPWLLGNNLQLGEPMLSPVQGVLPRHPASCMHQGISIYALHHTKQPLCAECVSAASCAS